MPLSREEIAAAEKMHAFVRQFEKQPKAQVMWLFLPIAISNSVNLLHSRSYLTLYCILGFTAVIIAMCLIIRRAFETRYKCERAYLDILERDHADELPWIAEERFEKKVEEHLAAVRQIQREAVHHPA